MSAFKNLTSNNVSVTDSIFLNGNPGNNQDVIINQGGLPTWQNIFGRVSKYLDTSDGTQDLNSGGIDIIFDLEVYNNSNISYGGNFFRFNDEGYYSLYFESLLDNDQAQSMVSFIVNGNQQYGQVSYWNNASTMPSFVPFSMSTILYFNNGDELRVFGEKVNSGPNYLKKNPIYGFPVTQLLICNL